MVGATDSQDDVRHFGLDHLGTIRIISSGVTGEFLARHTYFPFGQEASGTDQDAEIMKFTGHERDLLSSTSDPEDDLDYMHARFYSTVLGRFLSVDAAPVDDRTQPGVWNRYSYALGNALKFTDPTGLAVVLVTDENGYHFGLDADDNGVADELEALEVQEISVSLSAAAMTISFTGTNDTFSTPTAVAPLDYGSAPKAGETYFIAWWESDKTSDLWDNTRVPWSQDVGNPFGPSIAVLSLDRDSYRNPTNSHLHGTVGPFLPDPSDTRYLGYSGGTTASDRQFTHGCMRCNNTVIEALRRSAPPGTPVEIVK